MAQENPGERLSFAARIGMRQEVRRFFPLLQQGFWVRAKVGCTIRELLCRQFGIPSAYLTQRITTIFLDGKPVDSEGSRIADGATLALSAAMPGLVGATMRRGGYYAAMRGTITHDSSVDGAEETDGQLRLKLFNLLMAELGPGFLHRGILLPPNVLADFLEAQDSDFWEIWREIVLNGKPVSAGVLQTGKGLCRKEQAIELAITFKE